VIVNVAGDPSARFALAGLGVPLEQATEALIVIGLLSWKSLLTTNVATALLRIVQLPTAIVAWQVEVV
jgi:hypothetical protein